MNIAGELLAVAVPAASHVCAASPCRVPVASCCSPPTLAARIVESAVKDQFDH